MPDYPTHKGTIDAFIVASLENAIDDMGDDGINDTWITQIAHNLSTLRDLLILRHSLFCDKGDELLECAECGDETDDMHFICCKGAEGDKCKELIENLVYGDFIRPRWETEPNLANESMRIHLAHD